MRRCSKRPANTDFLLALLHDVGRHREQSGDEADRADQKRREHAGPPLILVDRLVYAHQVVHRQLRIIPMNLGTNRSKDGCSIAIGMNDGGGSHRRAISTRYATSRVSLLKFCRMEAETSTIVSRWMRPPCLCADRAGGCPIAGRPQGTGTRKYVGRIPMS